ncbi:hypothetical protein SMU40_02555 [Streptococcus mutans 15VF2]|nr:hypothetical protein SMU40_02555 [Streptococcus mutans 15VF2]
MYLMSVNQERSVEAISDFMNNINIQDIAQNIKNIIK